MGFCAASRRSSPFWARAGSPMLAKAATKATSLTSANRRIFGYRMMRHLALGIAAPLLARFGERRQGSARGLNGFTGRRCLAAPASATFPSYRMSVGGHGPVAPKYRASAPLTLAVRGQLRGVPNAGEVPQQGTPPP